MPTPTSLLLTIEKSTRGGDGPGAAGQKLGYMFSPLAPRGVPWPALGFGLLLLLTTSACAAETDEEDEILIIPYTHFGVPWVFDDAGREFLVDTGTPRSFLMPDLADYPEHSFTTTTVEGWELWGLGEGVELVVTRKLPPAMLPVISPTFGGIVGADILARRAFVLDPLRERLIVANSEGELGEWTRETNALVELPATIGGGGVSCMSEGNCFAHEGQRMLVEIEVEGVPVVALVDTGSSYTTMGEGLRLLLPAVTRPELALERGWDETDFTRVEQLEMGGVAVEDLPVLFDSGVDVDLARLSVEVGRTVDMLIGHSLLLHFAAKFDYPAQTLSLARYDNPPLSHTEIFQSFGVWLGNWSEAAAEAGIDCVELEVVARVAMTTQAELEAGDCIYAVEGETTSERSASELFRPLLTAPIGTSLEFGVFDAPQGDAPLDPSSARSVTLTMQDLLPKTP